VFVSDNECKFGGPLVRSLGNRRWGATIGKQGSMAWASTTPSFQNKRAQKNQLVLGQQVNIDPCHQVTGSLSSSSFPGKSLETRQFSSRSAGLSVFNLQTYGNKS
jgi:hypothetical protein